MGQKVNPIGLRLGVHRKWNSNWSFDFNNYSKFIYINFDIEKFFKGFLHYYPKKTLLMKCQIVKLPSNKLYIFVFFYKFRLKKKRKKKSFRNKNLNLDFTINEASIDKYYKKQLNNSFINNNFDFNQILIKNKQEIKSIDKLISFYKNKSINNLQNIINDLNNLIILKNTNKFNLNKFYEKNYTKLILRKKLLNNDLNILSNYYNLLILINKVNILNEKCINDNSENKNIFNKIRLLNYKINKLTKKIDILLKNNLNNENYLYYNALFYQLLKFKIRNKHYFLNMFIKKVENNNSIINKNNFKNFIYKKKYFSHVKIKNKLELNNNSFYQKLKIIKKFISKFTNLKVSIFFINSLSFAQFYYYLKQDNDKLKKNFNNIRNIEKQMVNRYRYDAIYVNDLVNIAFISILFKNPQFLVEFIAFQFKQLPKNKKQMKLIQLIIQVVQTFVTEREEVIGLKLKFKGRINKRKRARTIIVNQGTMTLQSDSTRVEYGYAQGYTKSGLIGIKLWIFYDKVFKKQFKKNFLQYLEYSKEKAKIN